jgi:ATP-dependent 26S proteasome regulatory subunit
VCTANTLVLARMLAARTNFAADTFSFRKSTSRMNNGKLPESWNFVKYNSKCLTFYRSLKRELVRAQEEIKRIQSVPLVIGQFMEAIDQKSVIN